MQAGRVARAVLALALLAAAAAAIASTRPGPVLLAGYCAGGRCVAVFYTPLRVTLSSVTLGNSSAKVPAEELFLSPGVFTVAITDGRLVVTQGTRILVTPVNITIPDSTGMTLVAGRHVELQPGLVAAVEIPTSLCGHTGFALVEAKDNPLLLVKLYLGNSLEALEYMGPLHGASAIPLAWGRACYSRLTLVSGHRVSASIVFYETGAVRLTLHTSLGNVAVRLPLLPASYPVLLQASLASRR